MCVVYGLPPVARVSDRLARLEFQLVGIAMRATSAAFSARRGSLRDADKRLPTGWTALMPHGRVKTRCRRPSRCSFAARNALRCALTLWADSPAANCGGKDGSCREHDATRLFCFSLNLGANIRSFWERFIMKNYFVAGINEHEGSGRKRERDYE